MNTFVNPIGLQNSISSIYNCSCNVKLGQENSSFLWKDCPSEKLLNKLGQVLKPVKCPREHCHDLVVELRLLKQVYMCKTFEDLFEYLQNTQQVSLLKNLDRNICFSFVGCRENATR